jgi:hypothetical protein
MGWKLPTSFVDESNVWTDASHAYDGSSWAFTVIPANSWGGYLDLFINPILCDKIRLNPYDTSEDGCFVTQIQVDVYNGNWQNIYNGNGVFYPGTSHVYSIPDSPQLISGMRFRFYNSHSSPVLLFLSGSGFDQVGINIYCGQDGNIDYDNPVAMMGPDDSQVTIINQILPPNTIWFYVRRAIADCGLQSDDSPACIVRIDANGNMLLDVPNSPILLTIEQLASAKFRLRWRYTHLNEEIAPTEFHIYMDSGAGFNFTEPAAIVPCQLGRVGGEYQWISDALTNGQQYRFCVRSYSEDAGESQNTDFVSAIADSDGPAAISGLQISYEEI